MQDNNSNTSSGSNNEEDGRAVGGEASDGYDNDAGTGAAVTPVTATAAVVVLGETEQQLLLDLRHLIESARERVAVTVNREMTLLYWDIGARLRRDVLHEQRAQYGKQIVSTLSRQLMALYGKGFSDKSLFHMLRFAEAFPERGVVESLSGQLGWSHFLELLYLKEALAREFYAQMCRLQRWSVRTLRERIRSMLYERTALSKNTDELVRQELALLRDEDQLTPDLVFRDPYLLDFLGLTDTYSERDLETAILREMEAFLLELGEGFSFVARQKRMTIDGEDFALDLLFYHRKLRRLVAVELKIGKFRADYKGQMELYLRWLDRFEREPGEEAPVGLILCSEAGPEQVALLQLDRGDIRVAQYLTEKLPQPLLEQELREAVRRAREQMAVRNHGQEPSAAALPPVPDATTDAEETLP